MKKVLVITYYWPPSGGSGVQRWLKFTKYLPAFGWQPVVFTPENPSFEVKDESLLHDVPKKVEVIKLPIWEPYGILNKLKGRGNQQTDFVKRKKKGVFAKMLLWIRGNFFIPDPRKFWVKPAVKVLEDLLVSNEIDVIITTGPPHSMHLIGHKLKEKLGIKWVADFRDPWTQWGLFQNFSMTRFAWSKHKRLEQKVLKNADEVITVSHHYAEGLKELYSCKIHVITNGFDDTEFEKVADIKPDNFVIRHLGVVDEHRNPWPLLNAADRLAEQNIHLNIEFVGNVNETLKAEINEKERLRKCVKFIPYVPHSEVLLLYRKSAVLLSLPMNSENAKGNIPGKIFEYLAAKRPILAIGDTTGDAAQIVKETGAGIIVDESDVEGIMEALLTLKKNFEDGKEIIPSAIEKYTRKNLTETLAKVLDQL